MPFHRRWFSAAMTGLLLVLLSGCNLPGNPAGGQEPSPNESETPSEAEPGGAQAPTETPAPFKTTLVLCAADDPDTLYGTPDPVAEAILQLVSPPAVIYGDDYTAEPGILDTLPSVEDDSLRRNEDGTISVRLRYRDDLVWSDGQPFDIADALLGYSLPESAYAPTFRVLDAQSADASLVVTAAADAEYPYVPSQPPLPSHSLGGQVDIEALAADGYRVLLNPSLGPYYLAAADEATATLQFEVNPHYAGAESLIPVVQMRFIADADQIASELLAGNCDMVLDGALGAGQVPQLLEAQASGQARTYIRPGTVYEQMIFNTSPGGGQIPYFADARVRQAFATAIDRAGLAEQMTGGLAAPLDSWITPGHWAYPGAAALTAYPTDPGQAAALLEAAGWRDTDNDGTREYQGEGGVYGCQRGEWQIEAGTLLTPTLIIPEGDALRASLADQLKIDLAEVGVNLRVQTASPDVFFAVDGPIVRGAFDLALFSAQMRPDPGGISRWVGADVYRHPLEKTVVHRWQLEDRWLTSEQLIEWLAYNNIPSIENDFQGQNFSRWCDEGANIATVQANLTFDLAERGAFYAEQQAIFSRELPVLPLFSRPQIAASAAYLCGVQAGPYDSPLWNVSEWTFDESGQCSR